jgi:hypothetical protein
MKIKEALKKLHEDAAQHSIAMSKGHLATAKCLKARGADFADAAAAHGAMADACQQDAENHLVNCQTLKAAIAEDLNKIVPLDGISSVGKVDVPAEAFGIRAVSRPGAPDPNTIDRKSIPSAFRHLVSQE